MADRHNVKIFVHCRKVPCVSCWNGSKTCVIEVSQCRTIIAEILGGPPAILVPTTVVGNTARRAAYLAANDANPERVTGKRSRGR